MTSKAGSRPESMCIYCVRFQLRNLASMSARIFLLGVCFLLLSTIGVFADERFETLTTKTGKVYTSVRVTGVTPQSIIIVHKQGISTIALADLPAELQRKFDYDPTKAAAHAQKLDDERKAEAASAINRKNQERAATVLADRARFRVFVILQNIPEGFLAEEAFETSISGPNQIAPGQLRRTGRIYLVSGHPQKAIADGSPIKATFVDDGLFTYKDTEGGKRTVAKVTYFTPPSTPAQNAPKRSSKPK
jgi:hypothetical protein